MQKQYGAIPYFYEKNELKVVLVSSASGYWIFPKGCYEEKLGKRRTAELEALEEAGVEGKVDKHYAYRCTVHIKSGAEVRLKLYALKVKTVYEEWPEAYRRKRMMVSVQDACELIRSKGLLSCLREFEEDVGREE